jgi:hypothetical protein
VIAMAPALDVSLHPKQFNLYKGGFNCPRSKMILSLWTVAEIEG